jgi:hypothetical protein
MQLIQTVTVKKKYGPNDQNQIEEMVFGFIFFHWTLVIFRLA